MTPRQLTALVARGPGPGLVLSGCAEGEGGPAVTQTTSSSPQADDPYGAYRFVSTITDSNTYGATSPGEP
jgi:hypothetical protein